MRFTRSPAALRSPCFARIGTTRTWKGSSLEGLRLVEADVRGRSVLLKPNLVEFFRGSSVNTDPRMVVAAANTFRRLGASSVVVAEGPGHRRDTEAVVVASGLRDALDDARLSFVDLNDAPLVRTPLRTRYTGLGELWVPKVLRDTEVVVSMPKLKTHHWVGVTLSLKNCFGCMPGRVYGWPKDEFHVRGIPESIVDIAAAVRPSLAIIDGIVGMEGDGPINGVAVDSGVVVVSRDLVAADVTGARLMGVDPEKVEYLMQAGRFLGQARSELSSSAGEDPGRLREALPAGARFRPHPRVRPRRPTQSDTTSPRRTSAGRRGSSLASARPSALTMTANTIAKTTSSRAVSKALPVSTPAAGIPQVAIGASQTGESLGRTTARGTAATA